MRDLIKLFEEVEEDFNLEGFAKPVAPIFRISTLFQKLLIQFDIDYPGVHQPFVVEDFKYPKRSGGINTYREFRDDWYAYVNYYVLKNRDVIYMYGNFISPDSTYYSFRYYYNKKTEEMSDKPLTESIEDIDDVSNFSEPNDWWCPECDKVGEEIIPNRRYGCNSCGIEWGPDVDDEWNKKGWHLGEAIEDDLGEVDEFSKPTMPADEIVLDQIEWELDQNKRKIDVNFLSGDLHLIQLEILSHNPDRTYFPKYKTLLKLGRKRLKIREAEDDLGEMENFDTPPRAKNFDKKAILKLVLADIENRFPGSPKFSTEETTGYRRCSARSGSGIPAWRYHIVRPGIGDIQIEVDPKEDRTEADIFVTVRWGLRDNRYTYVKNKYFSYVKGASGLDTLTESLTEDVDDDFGSLESFEKPAQAKTFNRKAILQMLLDFLRSQGIRDDQLPKDIETLKLNSPSSTGKTGWKWKGILKRTPESPYSSTLEVHARPTSDMNSVYLWVLFKTWVAQPGTGRNPSLKIHRYDLYYTKGDTFLVSGTN